MSQMIWCRPKAVIEKFIPNEYIAACGDSGTVYNFECNAGIKYRGDRNYHYNVTGIPAITVPAVPPIRQIPMMNFLMAI